MATNPYNQPNAVRSIPGVTQAYSVSGSKAAGINPYDAWGASTAASAKVNQASIQKYQSTKSLADEVTKTLQDSKSTDTQKYSALKKARAAGLIDQNQQVDLIKKIGEYQNAVDKQGFMDSLNPVQQMGAGLVSAAQRAGGTASQALDLTFEKANLIAGDKQKAAQWRDRARSWSSPNNPNTAIDGRSLSIVPDKAFEPNFTAGETAQAVLSGTGEMLPLVMPWGKFLDAGGAVGGVIGDKVLGGVGAGVQSKLAQALIRTGTDIVGKSAISAPVFTAADAAVQYGDTGKVDVGRALTQGAVGGLATGVLGMKLGGAKRLEALKLENPIPTKIDVQGMSATDKIPVKTRMTDAEYTNRFDALSKAYDKEIKAVQKIEAPIKRENAAKAIETKYEGLLTKLDDEWKTPRVPDATAQVKPVTQTAKVETITQPTAPKVEAPQVTKTPVVETKPAGIASATEQKATAAGIETSPTKAEFATTSYKENKITATELVKTDKQAALDIVEGKVDATAPQRQEAYKALETKAIQEADIQTIERLKNSTTASEASQAAQTLGQRGFELDPTSPVQAMKSIDNAGRKAMSTKDKVYVAKESAVIKKNIKAPTKDEWAAFVENLRC